jgi:tetratricopeptide (TPR) repeat protein
MKLAATTGKRVVQLYLARRFDDAMNQSRKTLELDPNVAVAYAILGQSYSVKGMDREALAENQKYWTLSHGSAVSIAVLGYAHGRLGERRQALVALDQLAAASKQNYIPAFAFAVIYAGLGEKDQAFAWLEKTHEERFTRFAYLRREAFWDPLRSDPRFTASLDRYGFPP